MYDSKDLGNLSDRELLAESRAYEAKLTADAAGLNFTNTEVQAIKAVNDSFESTLDAWDALQIQEAGISQQKAGGRQNVLGELRGQRNTAYADRDVSDEALAEKGIPPRDKVKTDPPALEDTSFPTAWVDTVQLKHIIHFRDVNTPETTRKPEGVRSCEIYRFVGDSPPLEDFDFVADDTNTPYTCNYNSADVGKKVTYRLRWHSKDDSVGTWSQPVEATVNG